MPISLAVTLLGYNDKVNHDEIVGVMSAAPLRDSDVRLLEQFPDCFEQLHSLLGRNSTEGERNALSIGINIGLAEALRIQNDEPAGAPTESIAGAELVAAGT